MFPDCIRDCISNLRFADDVLMMANFLKQLKRMMSDFKTSTEAQGLEMHADRKTVLSNQKSNRLKEIEIDGMHVEILPPEGKVKYLGQRITFMDHGNYRSIAQNPLCQVRVRQTSTGIDVQVLHPPTQVTSLRRCCQ